MRGIVFSTTEVGIDIIRGGNFEIENLKSLGN
jgi:hypothetical protein